MTVIDTFRLDGKVALVTGAASGIGRAIAMALTEAGADIAAVDRDEEGLAGVAEELDAMGARVHPVVADVSDEAESARMVEETVSTLGGLDVAFANAGISTQGGSVAEYDMDVWDRVTAVDLRGVFLTDRAAAGAINEGGSIINTASILGVVGTDLPGLAAYTAAKGGVIQLTKQLAAELGPRGIRVNAIAPGWIHTNIGSGALREDAPGMAEFHEAMADGTALKRLGHPEDIAGMAVFLASDASAYCTGATYLVDGGWTAF